MLRSLAIFTSAVTAALVLSGCGGGGTPAPIDPQPAPPSTPVEAREPADIVYADGWDELQMIANWAKTETDSAGHFVTSRNACGMPGYGSLDLETWNALAEATNALVKAELGTADTDEYCIPHIENQKNMDGTVEAKLADGTKRMLLEARGSQVCSKIKDKEAAARFLAAINKVVRAADLEDAQCGWARP